MRELTDAKIFLKTVDDFSCVGIAGHHWHQPCRGGIISTRVLGLKTRLLGMIGTGAATQLSISTCMDMGMARSLA